MELDFLTITEQGAAEEKQLRGEDQLQVRRRGREAALNWFITHLFRGQKEVFPVLLAVNYTHSRETMSRNLLMKSKMKRSRKREILVVLSLFQTQRTIWGMQDTQFEGWLNFRQKTSGNFCRKSKKRNCLWKGYLLFVMWQITDDLPLSLISLREDYKQVFLLSSGSPISFRKSLWDKPCRGSNLGRPSESRISFPCLQRTPFRSFINPTESINKYE